MDGRGQLVAVLPAFEEAVYTLDTSATGTLADYPPAEPMQSVHDALVLGIRDYVRKCGFSQAVVGLSGGVDSAVTCCLATTALGPASVLGVSMPSAFSSVGSVEDSRTLAANLGIELKTIPITPMFDSYLANMTEFLDADAMGVTEENLQARIRGNILMALSNRFGYLVLSTGNKSELAVGYCTLYGDMSGGLSVLSDVPKMVVYRLAEYVNRERQIIPQAIIDKPPSAELKPDQMDQDTLPPYPVLDEIIQLYVEEQYSARQIVAEGFEPATVEWVVKAIDRNEYKRRQAAPGLKVTTKAFGVGRRMPIAAKCDVSC
jgi:NAD+ synthase (glutamine-hydrolysing)